MRGRLLQVLFVLALGFSVGASGQDAPRDPFLILREGYARADADLAASAYDLSARYEERYDGTAPVVRQGRDQIRAGFDALFKHLKLQPGRGADLNFRLAADRGSGFYRLRAPRSTPSFGRFQVAVRAGRFATDISGNATIEDFEGAPGPLLFADAEEELDPRYYDRVVGRYLKSAGDPCGLIVTRSIKRTFVLDECTQMWRGLNRASGREWRAESRVIDPAADRAVTFDGIGQSVILTGARYGRVDRVSRTAVKFTSDVPLAGTLYRSAVSRGPSPAVVLIHGSGPRDRNGYASLMALYAEYLARRGFVVLSYDKRGVGDSGGDWAAAGFTELAQDAAAGLTFLRSMSSVDPTRIGLMGSSQAGWVAAAAIKNGAAPSFTILVGAAGSALTVVEQNIYNTETRMRCAGFSHADIDAAISQQRAFFAARLNGARQVELTKATNVARGDRQSPNGCSLLRSRGCPHRNGSTCWIQRLIHSRSGRAIEGRLSSYSVSSTTPRPPR